MKSLGRIFDILDLFEGSTLEWTVDELHQRMGYSRSTLYRYLKVLTEAGFLSALPDIGYTLGPRIAELDYKMRTRDPLILAARPAMRHLAQEVTGIALLCRWYRDRVLCVHQEHSTNLFQSNYERGRGRPLLRGAASRVILAYLAAPAIARLYEQQPAEFRDARLGASLDEVRAKLRAIRKRGWEMSVGQVTPGVTGIAAPVFDARENVLGSLSITIGQTGLEESRVAYVADRVLFCARIVTSTIWQEKQAEEA